tara:strand:- start:122 stop:280 length:159 start_codon:yes stop_codon:yes gene_type:complete
MIYSEREIQLQRILKLDRKVFGHSVAGYNVAGYNVAGESVGLSSEKVMRRVL